jgi:hypothetical protein
MPIRHVVFDFDGSCTRVQDAADKYLAAFRKLLEAEVSPKFTVEAWAGALARIRALSPRAGWMLGKTPAAPAAADPYILAFEAASDLVKRFEIRKPLPSDLHGRAYAEAHAPFREDLLEVLIGIGALGLQIHFVSNSSRRAIAARLDDLLANHRDLRSKIEVIGDAEKFRIREISPDISGDARRFQAVFEALPAAATAAGLGRPIYLRRGAYFEALYKVWDGDIGAVGETIVCGDIWELDLAMPAALGSHVHLITRAAPYDTYDYELESARAVGARGGISDDLRGLLTRLRKTVAA